jgi:hypothetical protein
MKVLKVEKAHSVFAHLLHVLAAEMTEASPSVTPQFSQLPEVVKTRAHGGIAERA